MSFGECNREAWPNNEVIITWGKLSLSVVELPGTIESFQSEIGYKTSQLLCLIICFSCVQLFILYDSMLTGPTDQHRGLMMQFCSDPMVLGIPRTTHHQCYTWVFRGPYDTGDPIQIGCMEGWDLNLYTYSLTQTLVLC